MNLEEAQEKARLAVKDLQKMYTIFTGEKEPYSDIWVFGDDGDYVGHEIIRFDGTMISLINNGTIEGYKDYLGLYPVDHLQMIMDKYFNNWERENPFCLNVYGIEHEEEL